MRTLLMLTVSLLLVFGLADTGATQITIPTNTFQPPAGTLVNYPQAVFVDESFFNSITSGTGGGHTWDFSSIGFASSPVGRFIDPATAPRIDSFPGANVVMEYPFGNDTSWNFLQSISSAWRELGTVVHLSGFGESVETYEYSGPQYVFPMAYNDSWMTTRDRTQVSSPQVYTEIYDTTQYVVDAYGTITYNGKSMPCLRIASTQRATHVTYLNGTPFLTAVYATDEVDFAAVGFDVLATFGRNISSGITSYYGAASGDFINTPTDIVETDPGTLPDGFGLAQNYPNPFNPTTDIQFSVPQVSDVRLVVYNVLGQRTKMLVNQQLPAGSYAVDWDGTDQSGNTVASGIYFYRLETGDFTASKKMLLLK